MTPNPLVILLAGGKSGRFWPLAEKNLLPFLGEPLIFHQINQIKRVGFKDLLVVTSQENFSVIKKISSQVSGLAIRLLRQKGEGQAQALLSAKDFLTKREILILNASDVVEDRLFEQILKKVKEENPEALLTGYKTDAYFPGGYLVLEKERVLGIWEKPGEGKRPSKMVRIVADYFANAQKLEKYLRTTQTKKDDLYEKAIDRMIKEGAKFKFIRYREYWGYLKFPWHVLDVMIHFLGKIKKSKISKKVAIDKSAKIFGPVILEEGVRIFENAKILGPCYLGKNVLVGNNALVRHSQIEEGSVVGFTTEVSRSFLGKNVWLHKNYVGDSVLEGNISLGSGAVLANLRLDERTISSWVFEEKISTQKEKLGAIIGSGTRIGVNVSIMPGIKIGKNCFVGSGVILEEDLPEGTFCRVKQKLVIRKNKFTVEAKEREKFRKNL